MDDDISVSYKAEVERLAGVPADLPTDEGRPLPLELACINDFYEFHPATVSAPAADAPRATLPDVMPEVGARRTFTEGLSIDHSGPATYYHVHVQIEAGQHRLDAFYRLVVRPRQGYVFLAGYIGTHATRERCFLVETHQLKPDAPLNRQVDDVIGAELDKLLHARRKSDHWGIGPPLLSQHAIQLSDQAYAYERDFKTGVEVLRRFPGRAHLMSRDEKAHARAWCEYFSNGLGLPRGEEPALPPEQAKKAYQELLIACNRLLAHLPRQSWPAFSQETSAVSYARSHVAGSDHEIHRVARHLMRGRRRPSARSLAIRILADALDLTPDRVRRLIRL